MAETYGVNLARAFLGQGMAFGFGDELEAYYRSLGGDARPYDDIVAEVRNDIDRFREDNPATAIGAELGGALATGLIGLGGFAVRGAATGAQAIARGAKVGAIEGGLFGTGIADPARDTDISEALVDRALGAASGAFIGAGLGAVGGAIGSKLARKAFRNEAQRISNEVVERGGDALDEAAQKRLSDLMEQGAIARQSQSEESVRGLAEGSDVIDLRTFHKVYDDAYFARLEEAGGNPEMMRVLLAGIAKEIAPDITEATQRLGQGGVVTDAVLEAAVRRIVAMGGSTERALQTFSRETPLEEVVAATNAVRANHLKAKKLSFEVLDLPEGSVERAKKAAELVDHTMPTGDLTAGMLGMVATQGRKFRRMRREFNFTTKEELEQFADATRKELGLTGDELAQRLAGMTDDQAGNFMARLVSDPKLAKDAIFEVWLNALLSGPRTQAVNVFSNAINAFVIGPTETFLAAGADAVDVAVRRTLGKEATREVFFKEAAIEFGSNMKAISEGLIAGRKAFVTQQSRFKGTKIDAPFGILPGKTGDFIRIPGRLLLAGDDLFKSIIYRKKLNSLAYSEAKRGLPDTATSREITEFAAEITANPTSALIRKARDRAAELTFTRDLGALGGLIQAMRSRSLVARVALPFFKTPANIVKFAAVRTPLAPLAKSVRADLAAGGDRRAHALARMAMGTSVGVVMVGLAGGGEITGGGPRDPSLRSVWWASGRQPYSVRIGDTYYSYGRIEPFGMLMGVTADFMELAETMKEDELDDVGGLIFGSIATNLVSKTWLRGPSELLQAIFDPERYGNRYVRTLASTVVPNILNQVGQAIDPDLKEARTIMDAIISRIPGKRSELRTRRDTFGKEIRLGGGALSLINPIFTSEFENSPVAEELISLKLGVSKVPKAIAKVRLNDDQLDRFRQLAGQHTEQDLRRVMLKDGYSGLNDEEKRVVLRSVMRRARDAARTQLRNEDERLDESIKARGDIKDRDRLLRGEFR